MSVEFEEDHAEYNKRIIDSTKITKRSTFVKFLVKHGISQDEVKAQRLLIFFSFIIFIIAIMILSFGIANDSPTLNELKSENIKAYKIDPDVREQTEEDSVKFEDLYGKK